MVTPLLSKALMAVMSAAVLLRAPAVTPRTVSVMVQVVLAATSMLLAVNGWLALTAANTGVPQFKLVGTGGLAIWMPACRVSVKLRPLRAMLPVAVLVMLKVSVVVPLTAMLAAPKALVSVGSAATLKHWSLPATVALVAVTLAIRLVCAAIGQVPVWPAALVSPATSMLQEVVPAPRLMPLMANARVPML